MKNWIYIWMTAGFLMGCASQQPVSDLLNDAQNALEPQSKECAAETYALAQKALQDAQEAQANGDVETARQKARLAQTLARQAKEEAENNAQDCEKRKAVVAAVEDKFAEDELGSAIEPVADKTFDVIYFDFDESFLSTDAIAALQNNVKILKSRPDLRVSLAAHTDERGTTEYNLALSQKRGDAVKDQAQNMGIDGARLQVVPYGKEKPASTGTREQDYALNRRVEFISI